MSWSPSPHGILIFNGDGTLRGKSGPTGIGEVLCSSKGEVLLMLSKFVGNCYSKEAEVLTILEALRLFNQGEKIGALVSLSLWDLEIQCTWYFEEQV